ncbi:MAG: DUF6328 family protein [Nocardioidaceae bacterium]
MDRSSEQVPGRQETPAEQDDRNFSELLQELRVSQMGVQILFAFLLTLAFQSRFTTVDTFQLTLYVVTLLCCAASTALLVAPVAFHRAMFRQGRKRELVDIAGRLARAGLFMMFLALSGAMVFILDFVLGRVLGFVLGGVVVAGFSLLWYATPWWRARSSAS